MLWRCPGWKLVSCRCKKTHLVGTDPHRNHTIIILICFSMRSMKQKWSFLLVIKNINHSNHNTFSPVESCSSSMYVHITQLRTFTLSALSTSKSNFVCTPVPPIHSCGEQFYGQVAFVFTWLLLLYLHVEKNKHMVNVKKLSQLVKFKATKQLD